MRADMNRVKFRLVLGNALLVMVSCALAVLVCEYGSRLFLNPADYLSVDLVKDKVLGRVMPPGASGFDTWGFRNRTVPERVDIVAIGDSHTYGNTAKLNEAWPQVLGRLTGRSTYNLALGGYGPNQYYHLLKTKALRLRPKVIIVGFYMGDEFENAFLITYGLDHWAYLRKAPVETVSFDIWEVPPSPTWHKRLRVWLSRHSVIYQLVFHGSLLGRLQGSFQIRHASDIYESAASLRVPEKNIAEAFRPNGILLRLNQQSESVREGVRITFTLLKEMNDICRSNEIQFLVAVIPTKEMVFSEYLERNPALRLGEVFDKVLANERTARTALFKFLDDSGIQYVDTLPGLKSSVQHELYVRTAADMHPNKNGYRVIAETVAGALTKLAGAK
jgi:hypothetical protein